MREVNRVLNHVAPEDAFEKRHLLQEELRARLHDPLKQNVIEFGRYWLGVKRAIVDVGASPMARPTAKSPPHGASSAEKGRDERPAPDDPSTVENEPAA